ncbi:hypothetical protein CXB51_012370 [Gossypium anomalum]|uniref:cytokinin riboside 5'-monophosphate phosphoribohydrolase n=1 Tax=Gossypium anomalum TaxID=47600 RepID=A0A8J5YX01_9ROSI|nr:hypothetical protein CXB51_012370 [Gossypium anomalum]
MGTIKSMELRMLVYNYNLCGLSYRYICSPNHTPKLSILFYFALFIEAEDISFVSSKIKNTKVRKMEGDMEMKPSKFKRICVFCGSSPGKKSSYKEATIELGRELVLVLPLPSSVLFHPCFALAFIYLLVKLSDSQDTYAKRDNWRNSGEVKAVADMHQRKAEMARQSDAFIALPGWYTNPRALLLNIIIQPSVVDVDPIPQWGDLGVYGPFSLDHIRLTPMLFKALLLALNRGYGTLEELLEVITWAQLGIHDKPVGLLNVDGYYNSLLSFIDKAVEEGFISPNARHIIVSAPTAKELVENMEEYEPQHERVASKLNWEMEQLSYPAKCEISR